MTRTTRHSRLSLVWISVLAFASVSEAWSSHAPVLGLQPPPPPPPSSRLPASASCLLLNSATTCSTRSTRSTTSSLLFASSASGVSSQSSKKKKGGKSSNSRKKKAKGTSQVHSKRTLGPGRSLSQEELTDHVSAHYINDRRGPVTLDELDRDDEPSSGMAMEESLEQAEFLKELNRRPALVLNADFQPLCYLPLSLWSWQDAIKAIFTGKVQVVDVYPEISVRAANLEVPLPSVIALSDYVPQKNQRPAFTRRNVFLRDEYKCQYCNDRFHTADLSLDHVKPRCMGGELSWENAVTSCLKCNGRKGSKPITELRSVGMRLIREPRCPSQMELAAKAARMIPRRVHPTWKPFLGIAETPKNSPSASSKQGDEDYIDDRYFERESEY